MVRRLVVPLVARILRGSTTYSQKSGFAAAIGPWDYVFCIGLEHECEQRLHQIMILVVVMRFLSQCHCFCQGVLRMKTAGKTVAVSADPFIS